VPHNLLAKANSETGPQQPSVQFMQRKQSNVTDAKSRDYQAPLIQSPFLKNTASKQSADI